jgi:GNAT superfamily N-acetyltransferase
MNTQDMMRIVQSQLAADMNCALDDLNGEKDSFIFTLVQDNPSRRPFPRNEQHFEMLSMGKSIVVSASPDILDIVKPLLDGKTRDEAFSMPFVYGHSLYYLPELTKIKPLVSPAGFTYEMVEQCDIPVLYQHEGFRNALMYDANHLRPDILLTLAKKNSRIVGMAGASNDCAMMWQVGVDVLSEYRNQGLAAYLVNRLTLEILNRGYIPYYGTASSNIASQRVAHRTGYYPAWVCAYRGKFDGAECSPTG